MKKFYSLIVIAGFFFVVACGGNTEQSHVEGDAQNEEATEQMMEEAGAEHMEEAPMEEATEDSTSMEGDGSMEEGAEAAE